MQINAAHQKESLVRQAVRHAAALVCAAISVPAIRADRTTAKVKQLFKIDLAGSADVSGMDGLTADTQQIAKTLFVDLLKSKNAAGIYLAELPAKI